MARFNIATPRKKSDGGTYWVNIGTAWEKDGKIQLVFDALPIPDAEGRCVANLFEPRERDSGQRQQSGSAGRGSTRADIDDSIPPF